MMSEIKKKMNEGAVLLYVEGVLGKGQAERHRFGHY